MTVSNPEPINVALAAHFNQLADSWDEAAMPNAATGRKPYQTRDLFFGAERLRSLADQAEKHLGPDDELMVRLVKANWDGDDGGNANDFLNALRDDAAQLDNDDPGAFVKDGMSETERAEALQEYETVKRQWWILGDGYEPPPSFEVLDGYVNAVEVDSVNAHERSRLTLSFGSISNWRTIASVDIEGPLDGAHVKDAAQKLVEQLPQQDPGEAGQ
jgi:hypothetical protein